MRELPTEDCIHAPSNLLLPLLENVPVGVRGEHDRAVPEQVLDVLECEALGEQKRRGGMTKVVEAAPRETSTV